MIPSIDGGSEKSGETSASKRQKVSHSSSNSSDGAYEPEEVRPEWIAMPPELQTVDFEKESVAWGK